MEGWMFRRIAHGMSYRISLSWRILRRASIFGGRRGHLILKCLQEISISPSHVSTYQIAKSEDDRSLSSTVTRENVMMLAKVSDAYTISGNPTTRKPHIDKLPRFGVLLDPIRIVFNYIFCVRLFTWWWLPWSNSWWDWVQSVSKIRILIFYNNPHTYFHYRRHGKGRDEKYLHPTLFTLSWGSLSYEVYLFRVHIAFCI